VCALDGGSPVTWRRAGTLVAVAVAAGAAAGVLAAAVAAGVIRSVAPALARGGRPSAHVAGGPLSTRDPHADALRFHDRLAAHEREGVDPSWASRAQAAYEGDLARLAADARFRLGRVDCRSTSCMAQLSFASFAAAKDSMQRIVLSRWTLNCAKEMNLDPTTDGAAEYATSIYFDCARARGSGTSAGN
jgi:hypothetical protein